MRSTFAAVLFLGGLGFIARALRGLPAALLRPFLPPTLPVRRPPCAVRRPRPLAQEGGGHA
jgi:hypothetical protein